MNPHYDVPTSSPWANYHNLEPAFSPNNPMPCSMEENLVDWDDRMDIFKRVCDEPMKSPSTACDYTRNQEKKWHYETGTLYPNISDKTSLYDHHGHFPISSKSSVYMQPYDGQQPLPSHHYNHHLPIHGDLAKPRKRGRPRKYPENKSRKKGRTQPILFEFLLEVLDNPTYAECVSWVERHRGTFKFNSEKKEEIAILWGKKKGNRKPMSYQKMARALRDYRQKGILQKIRKKLHYQFLDGYIPK